MSSHVSSSRYGVTTERQYVPLRDGKSCYAPTPLSSCSLTHGTLITHQITLHTQRHLMYDQ